MRTRGPRCSDRWLRVASGLTRAPVHTTQMVSNKYCQNFLGVISLGRRLFLLECLPFTRFLRFSAFPPASLIARVKERATRAASVPSSWWESNPPALATSTNEHCSVTVTECRCHRHPSVQRRAAARAWCRDVQQPRGATYSASLVCSARCSRPLSSMEGCPGRTSSSTCTR